jgi:hypothetical protein
MISVRVDEELRERMRQFPDVNWSEYIRQSLEKKVSEEEMKRACEKMDELAEKTSGEWRGSDEIRKWRDRRSGPTR